MEIKKQFTNRILSLVLSIMMVVSMLPMNIMTASAADGDAVAKVGDTEYTDFATAVANWTDGTTLTLLADVTGLTERIKTYAKGLILDLNGHKIECSDTLCTIWIDGDSGSELTIRDGKGDGYIQGRVYAVTGGSKLRLESGTVETVTANGDFIMTGGQIICEDSQGLFVNDEVDVVISGGEIYGSNYGVWIASGNVIISGDTKITGAGQYAITSFSSKVVISGTPTLSGTEAEFSTDKGIVFNTLPADGTVWRAAINTEYNKNGIFAVPGEGITLDMGKFASAMDGYEVKQNAKGELLLCNHQTAYEAVSNEDGSTHKMLCCCGEITVEASVACSGFGATCQTKAVCATCGQSYGETNPDVHTFNDDGKCVCGAERDAATTVDLSSLTATYVISDSGEYIFTGSGSYGIKVESGNPKIVLNNVNISLTDGDYYENNPINGIHIATTGGTTEILVLGESSITAKAGAGIFVAEGGTVKITGSSREDILIATGASGCSGIGGYVYYTNGYVNCGNIEISSVTVKAFGSQSDMGDVAPAIGGAGNANCGYITIDNADVYAEGFISPYGYEGSSAIGTGADFIYYEGGTIGEISIINDSKVYVTRGNYCDYIGCCGHENGPAEGVVDATAKSSTIYCYDTTDTTKPIQTLKYGTLGGLLKEDGTCEGEHTGIICDNCGYCSCTHEGGKLTYALTEDGAKHTATYDCCGMKDTEDHTLTHTANGNVITAICSENCGYGGKATISATGKTYDGTAVTADVEYSGGWPGSTDLTVTYAVKGGVVLTEAPKNAGTYTASITYEDVTASYDFTIEKATPKAEDFVFAAPTDLIYDGTAKPATITVKDGIVGMGEVNIIYFRDAGMWIDNEREPIYPGRYKVGIWIKEGDNYNAVYSNERIWLGDEFEIKYLTTDAKADISGTMGSNGWYTSDVTLTAPEGYQISKTKYNDGFESKLTISAEQNETITYYLKDTNGDVAEKTVELKIDKTAPSAQYQIGTNGWKQFINTITFGLFCKDYKTVDIEYTDELSGVATKQYYISSEEITDISSIVWLDYTDTLSLNATGKYLIYMRVVDNAGHEVMLNTEGIVIYEDSVQVTESVSTTYNAGTDKDVTVKLNGNTVNAIKNGNSVLTADTDYTASADGTITLKASYLDALNAGEYTFTVSYNPQGVETDKVNMTTTFTVKVEKADGKVSNLNISGKTYDGTAVTAPTFDKPGDGVATIEYKVRGADDSTYTTAAPKNAGNYVVRVTVAESTNYKAASATTYFAIASAELRDVSVQQNGKLTYNGKAQTPIVSTSVTTVDGSKVTFTYSTEMEGPYSTEIPSFTNVGWAHTVFYRATADNHNTYYGSFHVEIEKATVTEPTIASKPFNNSAQKADISDTDLYTVEKNNGGTEKGSYDVVLKLKDSANYKWSTTDNAEVTLQFKITQARNAWVTEPSISGWTYGEAANAPTAEAKFGTVYVLYDGTANDGTTYDGDTPPTKAGSYVARFFVDEATNYEPIGDGVEFIIAKADQAAPTGLTKTDTTYFGKADGKISGLTSAMEFRKEEDSAYTAGFNGTLEYLSAGIYYVRYQGDANHNPSPDAVVTVKAGRKLQIVVPQNQVGYTVTVNKTEMEYEGSYTLKVEIHEGYTATEDFKIIISNWECGQQAGVEETYMNAIADQIIEVRGVADITPPATEIKVKENKWTSFWNNLTFGLFFKETQDVTITADDAGSGVKSIQYYLFDRELERDEVRSITDWIEYNGTFKINPDNKYVVYAKITDNDGNVKYLNSEGIVLDATVPVIEGIENGKTYYTTQRFTVKESTLESVTVNGNPSMTFALGGNVDKIYVVVATDKAGNTTTVTVTMKPIKELAKATENLSNDNVTSADIPALHELIEKLNELIADPNTSDDGEKETLEQHKVIAESLLKSIEDAAKALDTENIEKVKGVTAENVTPEDKTDLEKAKADLEKALEDNGGNYTEDEKQAIEDNIKCIDGALEVIGNVEAVEDKIDKLPAVDTVKPDDEEAIKAITDAQTAYNTLSDYEKSLLDEATKTTLDKLAEVLMAYDIVEGDGSSWTEDSDRNITFVINGLFSKFVGIKVDGKDVDKANYEVKAGSTIITLKASYLDTLKVGEHTITVIYNDGSADGTFNVTEKTNAPTTGNHNNLWLWVALLFVSGAGVFEITLYDRKRRIASKK